MNLIRNLRLSFNLFYRHYLGDYVFVQHLIRVIFVFGLIIRIFVKDITGTSALIWYGLFLTSLIYVYYAIHQIGFKSGRTVNFTVFVILDLILVTVACLLSGSQQSDLHFFYLLPLFLIGSFLNKHVSKLFAFTILCYILCGTFLAIQYPTGVSPSLADVLSNLTPRVIIFSVIFLAVQQRSKYKTQLTELNALQSMIDHILDNSNLAERLQAIMKAGIVLGKAKGCKVYIYRHRKGKELLELAGIIGTSSKFPSQGHFLEKDQGLAWHTFNTQKINYTSNYKGSIYAVEKLKPFFNAVIEAPLISRYPLMKGQDEKKVSNVIGVIALFYEKKQFFKKSDKDRITRLASYAAATLRDVLLVEHGRKKIHQFNTLINNIDDLVYVKDANHRFSLVNKAQAKLLLSEEEKESIAEDKWEEYLIGKSDKDFYNKAQASKFEKDEEKLLSKLETVINRREKVQINNASKTLLTTKVAVTNENNERAAIIGIGRDITSLLLELNKLHHSGSEYIDEVISRTKSDLNSHTYACMVAANIFIIKVFARYSALEKLVIAERQRFQLGELLTVHFRSVLENIFNIEYVNASLFFNIDPDIQIDGHNRTELRHILILAILNAIRHAKKGLNLEITVSNTERSIIVKNNNPKVAPNWNTIKKGVVSSKFEIEGTTLFALDKYYKDNFRTGIIFELEKNYFSIEIPFYSINP